jgi:hypothetical protein
LSKTGAACIFIVLWLSIAVSDVIAGAFICLNFILKHLITFFPDTDALMVEKCQSKPKAVATKLQTFSWGSRAIGAIIVSFGGGVLIDTLGPRGTFGILGQ